MEYCLSHTGKNKFKQKTNELDDQQKCWINATLERLSAVRNRYYNKDKNFKEAIEKLSEEKSYEEIFFFLSLLQYPSTFSYSDIFFDDIAKGLSEEKINVAIQKNLETGMPYDSIKKKLKLDCESHGESSVPAIIRSKDLQIEELRNINKVKAFFGQFPYASVAEAAKTVGITNKAVREIINQAEAEGETIKYSNALRTIEYEMMKKQIIELKMEDPMISDGELAYQLEVPVTTVKKAIQEAVQMMKIENAQNFAFMAHQSAQQFKLVEDEAYKRHKATKNSSSEWLKIMVSTRQAIVELYGLKEPEKIDILHQIQHQSKEEKDAMVEAWYATDALDINHKLIEATKNPEGEESDD
jgi:DNA-binding transcriptional regulator YhcF (GntR family)